MKKYIYTFVFFVCAIAISRHIVSDLEQEERIRALEHQIEDLKKDSLKPETGSKPKDKASKDSAGIAKASDIPAKKTRERHAATETDVNNSPKGVYSQKFESPVLLELNTVDSATLTRIPGIGAKSASLIIKYRNQLGGYVSPYQIEEKLHTSTAHYAAQYSLYGELLKQSTLWGFMESFRICGIAAIVVIPLVMLIKNFPKEETDN